MTNHKITISDFFNVFFDSVLLLAGTVVFVWALWPESSSEKKAQSPESAAEADAPTGAFVLGDLGESIRKERDFTYPATLADVEKRVQETGGWVSNPVLDPYEVLYEFYSATPSPKEPLEKVRSLKNDSPESNALISDAFCRIPNRKGLKPWEDSPEVDYEAELHRQTKADATSFNPMFFNSSADADALDYTQTSLLGLHKGTLEYFGNANTIVSWETSTDHLMDKIVLRDDLLWSDGQPLTAFDWEFSYNVIMSSAIPIYALRSGVDMLLGVKAYDARTLVFFHQDPTPIAPSNISYYIIPKHIYEKSIAEDPTLTHTKYHQEQEHNPVTSGPYIVEKHLPNTSIVFARRENYYKVNGKQVRKKPFLKRIHFQISPDSATAFMQMKNGDIEIMPLVPEQWLTQATTPDFYRKNTKAYATRWNYFAFWFNLSPECPFFQDIRVRKAISLAFDYEEMLKVHQKGMSLQARGVFTESSPFFPKEANLPFQRQDTQQAIQLLKEAGWTDTDSDGILDHEVNGKRIPFEFSIIVPSSPESIELCNLLAQSLRQIGIQCNVQSMEFNVLCQREMGHKFQMSLGGWISGSDPFSQENIWGTAQGRNFGCYTNPKVDELFKAGLKEFDRKKRIAIYQELDLAICDDYPCIWLFNSNTSVGFNKDLRGVGFYFQGVAYDEIWKEK